VISGLRFRNCRSSLRSRGRPVSSETLADFEQQRGPVAAAGGPVEHDLVLVAHAGLLEEQGFDLA
jgi:hypothetical protein